VRRTRKNSDGAITVHYADGAPRTETVSCREYVEHVCKFRPVAADLAPNTSQAHQPVTPVVQQLPTWVYASIAVMAVIAVSVVATIVTVVLVAMSSSR
jgi:type VI protein secretion system component VasF